MPILLHRCFALPRKFRHLFLDLFVFALLLMLGLFQPAPSCGASNEPAKSGVTDKALKPSPPAVPKTGAKPSPSAPAPAAESPKSAQGNTQTLKVLRITPSGEDVPAGQEIVFQFDRPVVPLGRMERSSSEVPITIEPPIACQWRWLNLSTLACRLDEKKALAPSTRYRITVRPGMRAEDRSVMNDPVFHSFITERPKIAQNWFKTWLSPSTPQFGIRFNQPVSRASASERLYFRTQGGIRFPVTLEEDPDSPNTESGQPPQSPTGEQKTPGAAVGSVWLVTPSKELPLDEEVSLLLGAGVTPARGSEQNPTERVVTNFHTFPVFRFLGVECIVGKGKTIVIPPDAPLTAQGRCNPAQSISLLFSAPVLKDEVQQGLRINPGFPRVGEDSDPWEDVYSESKLTELPKKGQKYPIPLPNGALKAFSQYRMESSPGALKDEFGRPLQNPLRMQFATDHQPPDFCLLKRTSVLEKGLDTDAPLLAVNLDRVELKYESLTAQGKTPQRTSVLDVPKAVDVSQAIPLGIRRMIPAASGLVQGSLTTQPGVPEKEQPERTFFAQITPFHVHAKLGHRNTLVWVTDLQSGQPVSGTEVQIYEGTQNGLIDSPKVLASGKTGENGLVELPGTVQLDPELSLAHAYEPESTRLFVRCRKGGDMAVLPLNFDFQVATEGADHEYIPGFLKPVHGHIRTWGATAQGIYKVGDTVQYKIYVRDQDNRRFVPAPESEYKLKVIDPADKVVLEREGVRLSPFGAFDGEFTIPGTGAVGWYRFELTASFTKEEWQPMRVLVSDFTPSPFKVTTDLNGELFGVGDSLQITTLAKFHAGGPYTGASARITASVEARPFLPKNPKAKGFQFDILGDSDRTTPESHTLHEMQGKLDDKGALENRFQIIQTPVLYGRLTVESAIRDDRGKSVASRASATFVGRDRYVGLSQGDWVLEENKPASVRVLVVDRTGEPAAGADIHVTVRRQVTKASRVKGAGNAYLTQYVNEWVTAEESELVSTLDSQVFSFTPKVPGVYKITAAIAGGSAPKDEGGAVSASRKEGGSVEGAAGVNPSAGEGHETSIERFVVGKGYVLWESIPGNLLTVRGEKAEYGVGETARFLVENPFPGARALITVERFGVIQSWVKTLEKSTEIVEFPVLPDYLPGFYLSVLVVSPRVEKPLAADGSDLGKPAFRMGYVTVPVVDAYKEIAVDIKPNQEVYKPGDTVTVDLQAKVQHLSPGEAVPPVELAVAVLDDSVFDLLSKGKKAFDPYKGFYKLDDLDLENYNLVMHLLGREKLEKKGANPGGGGGPDLGLRSVFKFVSYWNPSLRVDGEGKARIQFQVPDNLTGWRVLAMAVTPEDRMGLGDTVFRVNRATEIRPVLPNQVIEGDSFSAGFSVMNRTEEARTMEVTVEATGPIDNKTQSITQSIRAEPYKRYILRLPLKTEKPGEIVLTARAGDARDKDALKQTLKVQMRQSPESAATYGTVTDKDVTETILFPDDMRPDFGSVRVTLAPTIMGGLAGAFEFARDYPFVCWEQQLTRAVMAAWYQTLKPYVASSFQWEESERVPETMLALAADHQAPNGGMTYYIPKDEYVDPYLSVFTALAFNWLRESGQSPPQQIEARLHEYLGTLLRKDAVPDFYTSGMAWTVRAGALAALADRSKAVRSDVERFSAHVSEMGLFGKALLLQTLARMPEAPTMVKLRKDVLKSILAQSDQTGGTFIFSESLDSRYTHLLVSSVRDNSAILSALLAYGKAFPSEEASLGDIPLRLMRTITQGRKGRAHWRSTQENVFAMRAMADFSRSYEARKPDVTVNLTLDGESLGQARFTAVTDPPAAFERLPRSGDPGRQTNLVIAPKGQGRVYTSTTLTTSPAQLKKESVNAGMELHREYTVQRNGAWILLQSPMELQSGEVVRVDLYLSLPAARHFVVAEDPVPGGLEPINRDLATASTVDASKGQSLYPPGSYSLRFENWLEYARSRWSFYHKELRHNVVRFYSEYLPAGRYHLTYVAQAVASGTFTALPFRAEEMYNPDVFGKGVPAVLQVKSPAEE